MKFLACPGQGSQTPGFLTPWLEAYPRLKDRLDVLSQASGVDLVELGTQADEDTIKDTRCEYTTSTTITGHATRAAGRRHTGTADGGVA